MDFKYSISNGNSQNGCEEDFAVNRNPSPEEKIEIRNDGGNGIMILANKEGWLSLARVCVEMAYYAEKDPAFHIHRSKNFTISDDNTDDAIGFFIQKK